MFALTAGGNVLGVEGKCPGGGCHARRNYKKMSRPIQETRGRIGPILDAVPGRSTAASDRSRTDTGL